MIRHKFSRLSLAIGGLISLNALANTENGKLEEVVVQGELSRYSALKDDTPIIESARSISIETKQNIEIKGLQYLDEVYTYSAGVTGETFGFATRGDWVRVRGLNVPLYQDSLQSLFGNYNNARPHVYTLEQVEILKGPASVLYGKGSPGGLVNIVSKTPQAEAAHEIVATVGNFNYRQLAFDSTGAIGGDDTWQYRVVGVTRDAETQVDFVEDNTDVFAPSIAWQPSEQTRITLLANFTKTEGDTAAQFLPIRGTLVPAPNGETLDFGTYTGDPDFNQYDTETNSITLLGEHQINDTWHLQVTSRYTDAEANYRQAWTSFLPTGRYVYNPDFTLYRDGYVPRTFYRGDGTSEQLAFDGRLRAEFETGGIEHKVLIGAQHQDVEIGSAGYYAAAIGYDYATGGPDAVYGDMFWINIFNPQYGNVPPMEALNALYTKEPSTTSTDSGLYISDQISVGAWRFTLGARFDDTSTETAGAKQDDSAVSTSIGALYQFDNGISPYVSFSESFEPVIGTNGDTSNPQPLDPQEGEQLEVGVKYQPTGIPAFVTLAYFDIDQTNLNDPSALVGQIQQQRGTANISGVELEAGAQFGDTSVDLNISQVDTESADGYQFASIPKDQASLWVNYTPTTGLSAGAGVRYVGESFDGADAIRTPSYTLIDAMLGYRTEQWHYSLNVRNATDKEYVASCLSRGDCFVGKERAIIGSVKYTF